MLATALFNCLAAFGYGLLLAAAMLVRRDGGWLRGLGWGAAGWVSFALAPALGLPPELPGAAEGALAARQLWWVYAAAGAAVGLALLVFARGWAWRLAGCLSAIAPQLVGAPGPGWQGLPPDAQAFAIGAVAVAAAFWLSLGTATGALLTRMRQP
jgi:cobalt transporter subunit CbtA